VIPFSQTCCTARGNEDAIDRRFYRKKYNAQQVLAQFAQTARDETDLDALLAELTRVVDETLQPEHVSIWLRKHRNGSIRSGFGRRYLLDQRAASIPEGACAIFAFRAFGYLRDFVLQTPFVTLFVTFFGRFPAILGFER
jgi:hypothetical protein